jgi:hypothetical protein
MILSFKTKIENKPTYFIEKIWQSIIENYKTANKYFPPQLYYECLDKGFLNMNFFEPKLHTIREDKNNRWKAGNKIDFFINARQKNMFRFAPVLPVVSIQEVEMIWFDEEIRLVNIYIDGECYVQNYGIEFNSSNQRQERMEQLAKNDGFDSVEDFLNYFNTDFTGKIIHWTDFKYNF